MTGRQVTIVVVNEDGTKESKVISFKEYRQLLDEGKNPQTVGIVPEMPNYWPNKDKSKGRYDFDI